ncbi:hypothetical protein HYT23_00180 [Candidatus Pacearchaeota archaeon]|nr:hypothetical protein [Candidatus Pacearchaeota archaeon]
MVKKMGEKISQRGQVTLFIILAIIIIALGLLIYFLFPKIKTSLGFQEESPYQYLEGCLDKNYLQDKINEISLQGGSLNPEHYLVYNGKNLEYLCYTNKYYESCIVQQPFLKRHVETEIENIIRENANDCFAQLENEYKDKGYETSSRKGGVEVELLPKRIIFKFNSTLTISKDGNSENFNLFRVVLNNNLYELVAIASSIVEGETLFGDIETTYYMSLYPELKVEKKIQTDGSTVYILTDRNTENKFQFASRSMAWPPGYG